jgi:hypothetical protein
MGTPEGELAITREEAGNDRDWDFRVAGHGGWANTQVVRAKYMKGLWKRKEALRTRKKAAPVENTRHGSSKSTSVFFPS